MTLEELIYGRLAGNKTLQTELAKFCDSPAVFLQKAPDDKADGWAADKAQYPRIDYLVDYVANPERHSSGMVTVNIYSSEESAIAGGAKPPEELVPAVRSALTDVILQADDRPYAVSWERTELFELRDSQSPNTLVNGAMLTFLLIAFPRQETKTPDPAKGMEEFIHGWEDGALVIGRDLIHDVYVPSDYHPAFYVRVTDYRSNRETYALRWIDCNLAIHVITPTPEGRSGWTRYLADTLEYYGEVILLDDSPMLIQSIEVDNAAEYLTRGQITVRAQFSIPTYRYAPPLKHSYFNGDVHGKYDSGQLRKRHKEEKLCQRSSMRQ